MRIKGSRIQGVKGGSVRLSGFAEAKNTITLKPSNPQTLEINMGV